MLKHYVEYAYPGTFFTESSTVAIKRRDYSKVKDNRRCFGFRFFNRIEGEIDGEIVRGKKKNYSCMYYFGKIYTLDEVKKKFPKEKILIRNIARLSGSKPPKAVLTRCGNWQIFDRGDRIIRRKK